MRNRPANPESPVGLRLLRFATRARRLQHLHRFGVEANAPACIGGVTHSRWVHRAGPKSLNPRRLAMNDRLPEVAMSSGDPLNAAGPS